MGSEVQRVVGGEIGNQVGLSTLARNLDFILHVPRVLGRGIKIFANHTSDKKLLV